MSKKVWILRLTHRIERDKRVTTHIALVARAFGANGMFYSGDRDVSLDNKMMDVCDRWGGDFKLVYVENPVDTVRRWREEGVVVHLTMYGLPLPNTIHKLRKHDNLLIIVGSEKVDPIFYELSDFNISVTNQPHSEIAALAVFLDYYYDGKEFELEFPGARYKVIPMERGKKVVKLR